MALKRIEGGSPVKGEAGARGARRTKSLPTGYGPAFARPAMAPFPDGHTYTDEDGVIDSVGAYRGTWNTITGPATNKANAATGGRAARTDGLDLSSFTDGTDGK